MLLQSLARDGGDWGMGDPRAARRFRMNPDNDQLYGRIRNGVLALSGNNPSIRVANGQLVIRDGPTAWVGPERHRPASNG
jgi:hypothetical protein